MTEVAAQPLSAVVPPWRVGLIGLHRQGWHLIERCLSDGPFQIIKAAGDMVCLADVACGIEEIITSPDIDVAWITYPIALHSDRLPPDLIERLLARGKHVVVEAPLSLSVMEADRLLAIARQHRRHLLVHSPRHADEAIRKALAAVNCDELGAVLAAKWISWSYAIPPAAESARHAGAERQVEDLCVVLIRQLTHALDQLVQLIPVAPLRVFAVGDIFQTEASCYSPTLTAWIEFINGAQAEVDIRLNSPAPLHTGWVIHSERGGYADDRRFTLAADGEVFDSPVTPIGPAVDDLVSLAEALRDQTSFNQTPTQTLAVVQLLEAFSKSADSPLRKR